MADTALNCSSNTNINSSTSSDLAPSFSLGQMFNQMGGTLPAFEEEDDQIEISLSLNKSVFQNMGSSDHTKLLLINSLLTQCLGTLNIKSLKGQTGSKNNSSNSSFCSGDGGGMGMTNLKQETLVANNPNQSNHSGGGASGGDKTTNNSQMQFPFNASQHNIGGARDNHRESAAVFYQNQNTTSHLTSVGGGSGGRMSAFGERNPLDLNVTETSIAPSSNNSAGGGSLNERVVAQAPGSPGAFLQYMGIESSSSASSNNNGGAAGGNGLSNFGTGELETCAGVSSRNPSINDDHLSSLNESIKCNSIAAEFGTSTYQCKQCMEVFSSARQLCAHAVAHIPHAPRNSSSNDRSNHNNSAAGVPRNKSPISQVVNTVSNHLFQSNENLSSLQPIYNPNSANSKNKKKYSCPECNFTSDLMARVSQHMILHSGMRPHECQLCNKRFKRRYHLDRHLGEVHMGGSRIAAQQPATTTNLASCTSSTVANNSNATQQQHQQLDSQNSRNQQQQQQCASQKNSPARAPVISPNPALMAAGGTRAPIEPRLTPSHFVSAANNRLTLLPPPNEVFALQAATNVGLGINSQVNNSVANQVERFAVPHFLTPLMANSNNR